MKSKNETHKVNLLTVHKIFKKKENEKKIKYAKKIERSLSKLNE